MPSASQHVWDKYKELFETDTADDGPATAYLEAQGWKLRRDFCWTPREGFKKGDEILEKEKYALLFLIEEWDYGGVIYPEQEAESLDGMSRDDKFEPEFTDEQIEEMNKTLGNQGG